MSDAGLSHADPGGTAPTSANVHAASPTGGARSAEAGLGIAGAPAAASRTKAAPGARHPDARRERHAMARRLLLPAAAGLLLLLHGALAAWLLAHPPSLASDDAFNFARALTRFSILDFSPHFPGYPAFVGLGRLVGRVVGAPVAALQATSILAALALPPALAYGAWRMAGTLTAVLGTYLLALTCPLLPVLALSGLSDGTGLVFFVLFLALMAERTGLPARPISAGIALALAVCARPSYGPMYGAAAGVLLILAPRRTAPAALVAAAGCGLALVVILAREGMLYFHEGARFLEGHTQVWGNTLVSGHARMGWGQALAAAPLVAASLFLSLSMALAGMARGRGRMPQRRAVEAALLAMIAWTIAMQNAEHLRHLAPLFLLSGLLLATGPAAHALSRAAPIAVALLQSAALLWATTFDPALPAPLATARAQIARVAPTGLVVTNEGVAYLRSRLSGQRVVDAFDPDQADAALATTAGPRLRLSSQPVEGRTPVARFPGRVPGEGDLFLYDDAPEATVRQAEPPLAAPNGAPGPR